jgi:hypothetical protein
MGPEPAACASNVQPESAWKLASDLRRFDESMTIFGGWRGTVPSTIEGHLCLVADQGQGLSQRHSLGSDPLR